MSARYHIILDECKGTSTRYWGQSVGSAGSILDLQEVQSRLGLNSDQIWHVLDRKSGKEMSEDEFFEVFAAVQKKKFG